MAKDINLIAQKYLAKVMELRELIHMYPEDGYSEFKTSKLVADTLRELGIEVKENVARTGVVGLIRGKYEGKTVLLRADMDALKLQEYVDVPYKSKVDGMMHACGHDGHTAGLLGAAMILNELKDELHGNVKFAFQPAEELEGGALPMIEEGVLENPKVDVAFGGHLWGGVKAGKLLTKPGPIMASPIIFNIKIIGRGGHGSMPHQTIDPTIIGAEIITSLQTIVSRMNTPLEPLVVSIGKVRSGAAFNVIPNEFEIEGNIRVISDETAERVRNQIETLVKGITSAYGATYEFDLKVIYPTLVNDAEMAKFVQNSTTKVLGEKNVATLEEISMGGEDFSFFCKYVPSAFFFLGITENEDEPIIHHNPYFCWDSKETLTLSKCMAQIAYDFLA
ncbi:N-acyl-L-amino acid amidohydrolase [Candidatus Epulonipiscium fishelsonii]|uniref:N-acyl-L-amino acid amidohydrolase n=1 Tax=Candidatus Epulonipiscium fishelsonii TaxID=77094 RepID=A0ACC8XH82_9FIRM|nr:N-acyl-L-amino acid amidohydrolase [Epulopiscium sp. SCG-B05WGA-EpuloA1]ONI43013.1 N-acyl-L-amino acid amidohydrolase [Epulopiscium sp. SCG-B11WGA-EpuloA1]